MESTEKAAPLEDLMVAMDVVDTLRHRQQLVDRELDADARRERLIEKLRDIYQSQGIEVTDQLLADGVKALEEDRFKYTAPSKSFSTWLAKLYIKRDKWLKPLLLGFVFLLGLCFFYYLTAVRPAQVAHNELPEQLRQSYGEVIQLADEQEVLTHALELQSYGKQALNNENFDEAQSAVDDLELMLIKLKSAYQLRVLQEPGERSGVWRIPDANSGARNYYIIIEAVDSRGVVLSLPITSEESGKTKIVSKWGVRVDQSTYQAIGADKKDDGIIQDRGVGQKQRGKLHPEYSISSNGAAITDW